MLLLLLPVIKLMQALHQLQLQLLHLRQLLLQTLMLRQLHLLLAT